MSITAAAASGIFSALTAGVVAGNQDINLRVGGSLLLNDALIGPASIDAGTGDIRIQAGGTVDQLNVDDRIFGDALGILANGAVTLATANNDVNTLAISTNGLVEFFDIDDLSVDVVAAGGPLGFAGATGLVSGNNDVELRTGGALQFLQTLNAGTGDARLFALTIGQVAAGAVVADELGAIAIGGNVSLGNSGGNDINLLAISSPAAVMYFDADDLIIGTVPAGSFAFPGATGISGSSITGLNTGPLTVTSNVTAFTGSVILQADDSAAPGHDLTVDGGVTIQAATSLSLRAGDDLNLLAGSNLVAGTFVQGVVDLGGALDAGIGGIANLNGSITAPGAHQFVGFDDPDTFFSAAGADTFQGNGGNDRFVWDPGDGNDTIIGGNDIDTLVFNGSAGNEQFSLNPVGTDAVFTRNLGGIVMTTRELEQLELAAGDGTNQFIITDMSATALTGLIVYNGGSGTDTIGAAAAVNPFDISSGGGDDQIATGLAADRLRGEAGGDFLDGGGGNDTAVFGGNIADYQFSFLGSDIRIADLRIGAPEGADTLRAIENAEFANTTVQFLFGTPGIDNFVATGNQAIVAGTGDDTITFDFRLVDATVTYSGHSVLIESASTHTVVSGFERFAFTDGTVNNIDADVLVDDLFYYSQNHDVWTAQLDADQHFHTIGRNIGRDPNAFFSTTIYLSANPDVAAAGVDPLVHFDQSGWKEGRVPSLAFDPRQYLDVYPDVAAAQVDPLAHFLRFGAQEGRLSFAPSELIVPGGFDYVFYLESNPDVAAANVDPLLHFQTFGWREGRNPNALFDVNGYLAAYADVDAAGVNPLEHYDRFGWREGRDPSGAFDTDFYLANNPDVASAGVNPLQHYLQFGVHEGRAILNDGVFN